MTVDARMLHVSGIGTYLEELLPRIVARWPEARFTLLGDVDALRRLVPDVRADVRAFRAPIYSIGEQLELPRLVPADSALLWVPHYNVPLLYRGPLAVTVHDVNHLVLPQPSLARQLYARTLFAAVRRRASAVLCVSEFTAGELRRLVGTPRSLTVTPNGVGPRWFSLENDAAPVDGPYFLYVGNVKPHKNLRRLLAAFERVAGDVGHRLVIVGRREGFLHGDDEIASAASALGDRVVFTGYVERPVLERYVAACDALVLPSLHEGFGLPALEALASGRAVCASGSSALPEVCGPLADYFDPLDVESIAASLRRVARRLPDTAAVREARRQWARRFDWDDCADLTMSALRDAAVVPAGEAGR